MSIRKPHWNTSGWTLQQGVCTGVLLALLFMLSVAATFPIKQLLLQGDANGGGHSFTNLATISASNFVGDGSGLTNLPGGGGGGSGTVTNIETGDGLSGGPITTNGTIAVDASVARTNLLVSVTNPIIGGGSLAGDFGIGFDGSSYAATNFSGSWPWSRLSGAPGITNYAEGTNITLSTNSGILTINSSASGGGGGTVTSVGSGEGLTGGPITGSGTLSLDITNLAADASIATNDYLLFYDAGSTAHRKIERQDLLQGSNLGSGYDAGGLTGTVADARLTANVSLLGSSIENSELSGNIANSKLADMAGKTIKGNDSAGTAAPDDLTVSEVKAMLGGESQIASTFTQVSHGFTSGNPVVKTGSTWELSSSTNASTANTVGIVESVAGNDFTVVFSGLATLSIALTEGDAYWLGDGVIQTNAPSTSGHVDKPIGHTVSTNQIIVNIERGIVVQ